MKIAEMLKEEIARSDKFTQENFGLQVGSSFPELVRECIEEDRIQMKLVQQFLMQQLRGVRVLERVDPGDLRGLTKESAVYESPMSMLYWGIEIGRRLAQQESEALRAVANE